MKFSKQAEDHSRADCTFHMAFQPSEIKPWPSARFEMIRKLQDAHRNQGSVYLMLDKVENMPVAVKEMPLSWIGRNHDEFMALHPKETELPWQDIGCTRLLNSIGFPFGCTLLGVYRNDVNIEVVTTYCNEGDLFTWCNGPLSSEFFPGPDREALVRPIVIDLIEGVGRLHELSTVHRDISMENILLSKEGGELRLRIIDFGVASTIRHFRKNARGKVLYQAPEIHEERVYDAFLADAFAVGLTVYGLCFMEYPWVSTKPGACKCFEFLKKYGFRAFAKKKKLYRMHARLNDCMSEELLRLLDGLLAPDPVKRLTLGELAFDEDGARRRSVWDEAWLYYGNHCAL
jgi:serine/threonine protein kinase